MRKKSCIEIGLLMLTLIRVERGNYVVPRLKYWKQRQNTKNLKLLFFVIYTLCYKSCLIV